MFLECQQGLINTDYVVHITTPVTDAKGASFQIVKGDGRIFIQQFPTLALAQEAFRHTYRTLITNNG